MYNQITLSQNIQGQNKKRPANRADQYRGQRLGKYLRNECPGFQGALGLYNLITNK
jgi:hypothetical protein